jgi:hypothetical protein
LPIYTTFRTADITVFGACMLTKPTGLRMHQPTDHRLRNAPLRQLRWLEQGKVQQTVCHGRLCCQHGAAKQDSGPAVSIHASILYKWLENVNCNIGINKQGHTQRCIGVYIVSFWTIIQWECCGAFHPRQI